jgi:hypothetical protein
MKKKAARLGDPHGTALQHIALMHQCLSALLEEWNVLSAGNKILQWADGTWCRTHLLNLVLNPPLGIKVIKELI